MIKGDEEKPVAHHYRDIAPKQRTRTLESFLKRPKN